MDLPRTAKNGMAQVRRIVTKVWPVVLSPDLISSPPLHWLPQNGNAGQSGTWQSNTGSHVWNLANIELVPPLETLHARCYPLLSVQPIHFRYTRNDYVNSGPLMCACAYNSGILFHTRAIMLNIRKCGCFASLFTVWWQVEQREVWRKDQEYGTVCPKANMHRALNFVSIS